MKQCNKCHIEKLPSEFSKRKDTKDGLQGSCKQCYKQLFKQWCNNNSNRQKTNVNKWRNNNQDKPLKYITKCRNKTLPGVYQVKCMVNGKRYIGQSEKPVRRKYEHFTIHKSNKSITYNEALQADLKLYGKQSFIFGVIEHCPTELLLEREAYYINTYKPEYNAQVETLKTTI